MLYRIRRIVRPDITGDVHLATATLARKALGRLDRGHTPAQVRAWVTQQRQVDRYGPLAMLAILTVLATPTREREPEAERRIAAWYCPCGAQGWLLEGATDDDRAAYEADREVHFEWCMEAAA